jgi:hypothetical protein
VLESGVAVGGVHGRESGVHGMEDEVESVGRLAGFTVGMAIPHIAPEAKMRKEEIGTEGPWKRNLA